MNPTLASLICACGIAGLFYLDRDSSLRTSKALWIPVIWIWIIGSRPVSDWLGVNPGDYESQFEGSPVDAAVFGVLTAAAIGVLIFRGRRTRNLLLANWPILLYVAFCLISVLWSYHPDIALKRWVKAIGDLAMVLVIVTEPEIRDALTRVFSRVGFLLFPTSILLIKYYGFLGRNYDPDGGQMNTGVTTNKNLLGVILLVISLGTVWSLLALFRDKGKPNRRRHLIAQGVLLAFEIVLLDMADSKTSIVCFLLGGGLILATSLRVVRIRPAFVHMICLAILATGGLAFLTGGEGDVATALGRKSNLSGRTMIWSALIPAAPNPIVGAGFESFWISPSVLIAQDTMRSEGWWHPEGLNEAHNGYVEVYLELGWVGVVLISLILVNGYLRAGSAFRVNSSLGALMLAYIIAAAVYSVTEAGFRMLDPIWDFLLLAVVGASGIAAGLIRSEKPSGVASRSSTAKKTSASDILIPERKSIYTAFNQLTR
jgi:O-antigen ligase